MMRVPSVATHYRELPLKWISYISLLLHRDHTLIEWPNKEGYLSHLKESQGCVQFRVESTLTHSTQFSFELTFELIFECATLWMPIHWAEWGFIGLVRTISFNSHSRIDSLLSKSSHGWECECARMAFELDTTLMPRLKVTIQIAKQIQGQCSGIFLVTTYAANFVIKQFQLGLQQFQSGR